MSRWPPVSSTSQVQDLTSWRSPTASRTSRSPAARPAPSPQPGSSPAGWCAATAIGIIAVAHRAIDEVKATLAARATARVGLSPPVAELDQVAGVTILADIAMRSIPIGRQEVGALDDHLSAALVVASPQLARRLVHRVLGPVADLPGWESEVLLRTLRCYMETGGSVAAVARTTHCHRNTVMHRMRRVQDLTGLSAAHPDQAGELRLALLATELLAVEPQPL